MICEQIGHTVIRRPHRNALSSNQVVLHGQPAFDLVVRAHKQRGDAVDHAFYLPAVRVVGIGRNRAVVLFHLHQAVLGVVAEGEGVRADDARGLVPIGVVGVGVAR